MLNQEKLDWQGYEVITKYIHEILGNEYGVKVIGHGKDCKVKGKSGVFHQIDVLTEQTSGPEAYRTAIECKFWNKKVTKDTLMKLLGIMEDADIAKGIVVSKAGFTPDALTFANHKGIELINLREVQEKDLNGNHTLSPGILDVHINSTVSRPFITNIDFGTARMILESSEQMIHLHNASIITPDGKQIPFQNYMTPFQKFLRDQDTPLKIFTEAISPATGEFIMAGNKVKIEKLVFTGFLQEIKENQIKSFTIQDQVYMIMEKIFEHRVFVLSDSGLIYKFPMET
ncbi:restriction endonuclease [Pedobacter nototheniae]|uniref:restriction endonuclease n=1 Tax=Pedobacter nototheniae TaxID=2488994 RepID=UPI0010392463|nr:restriction endonuclease [Pedobacter nototheniae]